MNLRVLTLLVLSTGAAIADETPLERATYLMRSIVACCNCHTPQGPNGPLPGRELAGGLPFREAAFTAYASNITPDKDSGIGRWTDAQIVTAIREGRRPDGTGVRPDGSRLKPPMGTAYYSQMNAADLDAVVAYLRSLPPK